MKAEYPPPTIRPLHKRKQTILDQEADHTDNDDLGIDWSDPMWRRIMDGSDLEGLPVFGPSKPNKATCKAQTRRGTPCACLALQNGRCRLHGGLSTGPKTAEGRARTAAGYRAWRERKARGEACQ